MCVLRAVLDSVQPVAGGLSSTWAYTLGPPHRYCVYGVCSCFDGFAGDDCSVVLPRVTIARVDGACCATYTAPHLHLPILYTLGARCQAVMPKPHTL